MVSNISVVNRKSTRLGLFLLISGLIFIFKQLSFYLGLVPFLLFLNVYLPAWVVPRKAMNISVNMCLSSLKNIWRLTIFNKAADINNIVLYLFGLECVVFLWTRSPGILLVIKTFITVFFQKTPCKYAETKYLV